MTGAAPPGGHRPVRGGGDGAFTGRADEVQTVLGAVGESPVGMGWRAFAFDGQPGVGKSMLARHLHRLLRPRFGERAFAIELHTHARHPVTVTPADILQSRLSAAGQNVTAIAEDEQQLSHAWRTYLAAGPSLLLLDDVQDAEQVRLFLPEDSDCLVLITSRARMVGLVTDPRVELVTVPPFDDDTAVALVEKFTPYALGDEHRRAVVDIARLTGHLPMAVSLVAARLATAEHRLTTEGLLTRLRAAGSVLKGLEGTGQELTGLFEMSYVNLPERHRTLSALGLIPGTHFDAYAVAAATAVTHDEAAAELWTLYDNSLLAAVDGGFAMHDLFRDYMRDKARTLGTDEGRLATLNGLAGYYQHTAAAADRHFARHVRPATAHIAVPSQPRLFADRDEAQSWLRAELDNILATIDEATRLGSRASATAEHAVLPEAVRRLRDRWIVGLTASIAAFLRNEGLWGRAAKLHDGAVQAAARLGDPIAEANALSELFFVFRLMGDFPAARTAAEGALAIYQRRRNRLGEANTLSDLAVLADLRGDHERSIDQFCDSLVIYQELGEKLGEANANNDLAFTYRTKGRRVEAVKHFKQAAGLFHMLGNLTGQAHALYLRGATLWEMPDGPDRAAGLAQAAAVLTKALDIYRNLGNSLGEANAQTYLGAVRFATGDRAGGFALLNAAVEGHTGTGSRRGLAEAHRELGRARAADGDAAAAIRHLTASRDLQLALGMPAAAGLADEVDRLTAEHPDTDDDPGPG